jgi:hypothetical protein
VSTVRKNSFVRFSSTALAALTASLLISVGASAKNPEVKASDGQAGVVAHIPFTGASGCRYGNSEESQ